MTDKKLLETKAGMKKRKPDFKRQEAYMAKLKDTWRKPRGLHSKLGKGRRGHGALVRPGYQTPVALRGMDKQGLLPVRVANTSELAQLDPKRHCVLVASVGGKKRIAIIEQAMKKGLTLHNATEGTAKQLQERYDIRTKTHKQKKQEKQQRDKKLEERLAAEEKKAEKDSKDKTETEKKKEPPKQAPTSKADDSPEKKVEPVKKAELPKQTPAEKKD